EEREGGAVGGGRQLEPAVLARDLDAERAEVAQALDRGLGDARVALDALRVDFFAQEALERGQERLAPLLFLGVGLGPRVDERQVQPPQEQLADERRRFPGGLARALGAGAGFVRAHVRLAGFAHLIPRVASLRGSCATPDNRFDAPRPGRTLVRGRASAPLARTVGGARAPRLFSAVRARFSTPAPA